MRSTILILEPRLSARSTLRRVIEELEEAAVLHADTTAMGAEVLGSVRSDIAFVDLSFSGDSALHFIAGIRQGLYCDDHRLPIIAVGEARADLFQRACNAGVHGFMASPYSRAGVALQLLRVRKDRRAFIETKTYIGPDRRRWNDPSFSGHDRRASETEQEDACTAPVDDAFYLS